MVLQQNKSEIQRRKKVVIAEKPCDKPFTFKAIPRLLSMVKPSRKAKAYCEKLAKSLEQEGYLVDAKIVHESIKIMEGEKVPIDTMDEEAKQFAEEYSFNIESGLYQTLTDEQRASWKKEIENAIKVGVSWQTERFENNRLNAFKNQTEEEAQIEMDFAASIIEKEHRTPTFDDAIKYGMRLQQMKDNQDESDMALIAALDGAERGRKAMKAELMKNAIDGHIINDDGTHKLICPSLPIIIRDMEEGDRVKVIVLKEEQQ